MNKFTFSGRVKAVADERLCNDTFRKLFKSFCFSSGEIDLSCGEKLTFVIGDTKPPVLKEGKEYALCVDGHGMAVSARDYGSLVRGVIALMMKIEFVSLQKDRESFAVGYTVEESGYSVGNRMIHICIFPENDLYFIKKVIRLAGLCQYTHVVLEFWGMLQYDCLRELAWDNAFSKDEVRSLIREIRDLGMEAVPMFNHFGHATQSRLCYGKHVVLDRNPALQPLFTPDGWAWDINSCDVYALLKNVRQELYELFGDGEYFHIGCDEAYYYTRCDALRATVPDYLKRLTNDIEAEGRRPMMWMDMLLQKGRFRDCYGSCESGEDEKLINALSENTVMVDWQYDAKECPVESMLHLNKTGYDVIGAPWLNGQNYRAVTETVIQNNMFGVMLTTWHTLQKDMYGILGCAKAFGAVTFPWSGYSGLHEETATLLRKVSFEGNSYSDCGWSKEQIEI